MKYIKSIPALIIGILISTTILSQSINQSQKNESGLNSSKNNLQPFNWLIGTWKLKLKNGILYEVWVTIDENTIQNKGFLVKTFGDTILNETVKIEYKKKNYYYTSTVTEQNNQQPIPFKITKFTNSSFIAENAKHDYPQRISYQRIARDKLYAFIDGKSNGKYSKNEFLYERENTSHRDIVLKLFDAFNRHDWKTYAECYSSDADFLNPAYGKEYIKQSYQQLVEKYSGYQKLIPDIRDEVIDIYESMDKVIVEFISVGTFSDNKKLKLSICTVFTIKQGKIARDATYFDQEP